MSGWTVEQEPIEYEPIQALHVVGEAMAIIEAHGGSLLYDEGRDKAAITSVVETLKSPSDPADQGRHYLALGAFVDGEGVGIKPTQEQMDGCVDRAQGVLQALLSGETVATATLKETSYFIWSLRRALEEINRLDILRDQIDIFDYKILQAKAKDDEEEMAAARAARLDIAARVWPVKSRLRMPVEDKDREQAMRGQRLEWGQEFGLEPAVVNALLDELLKESKQVQSAQPSAQI